MADYNDGDKKAQKYKDKHVGIATQQPRAGFARIGTPTNASEIIAQQNIDWRNSAL